MVYQRSWLTRLVHWVLSLTLSHGFEGRLLEIQPGTGSLPAVKDRIVSGSEGQHVCQPRLRRIELRSLG